ncbi:MAG: sugar-binding protein [Bacteroidales bacterium]
MAPKLLIINALAVVVLLVSAACSLETAKREPKGLFPKPNPKGYVCYRPALPLTIDGVLAEEEWAFAPWTDEFVDIEGDAKPKPRFSTRVKMLWDDQYLYIAAEMEEPHLWATLKMRDTVIFYDHDFEVFIDPDGDTHQYYELEVNALGTAWDLLLIKPYRDGGPPVNGWDIAGLRVGISLAGTLNDPSDLDAGWSVELALPLDILKECAPVGRLPAPGDQWRINFSRVEWRMVVENGNYRKEINPETGKPFPEDNWVWSPQGAINMHMPEMWGYLQFSGLTAGSDVENFARDPDSEVKWMLREIYYAQRAYFAEKGKYAGKFSALGLASRNYPGVPLIKTLPTAFEASAKSTGTGATWLIREDGRLEAQSSITTRLRGD